MSPLESEEARQQAEEEVEAAAASAAAIPSAPNEEPELQEVVLGDLQLQKDKQNFEGQEQTGAEKHILQPPKLDLSRRSRQGSVVSFREKCDMFEIDSTPERPPALFSLRFYIMILALLSPFVVTYSKTIINFALIDMIHPDFRSKKPTVEVAKPSSDASSSSAVQPSDLLVQPTLSYFDGDNSCPVNEDERKRLNEELQTDKKRAAENSGEKFDWDTDKQGLLKASYSIGHSAFQILGGRLSETYGPHVIMSISSVFIGVSCLLAPFLAASHFYLLFADLFLLGLLGSFMTPGLITLFTYWLTPSEKSIMMSFYLVSSRLGYAFSALLCGFLINAHLSWHYLFYSAGVFSLVFALLFVLIAKSRPIDHYLISQAELDYLSNKNTLVRESLAVKRELESGIVSVELRDANNKQQVEQSKPKTATGNKKSPVQAPWVHILRSPAVWAFVITKFCVKLAGDTVQIELPIYLDRVMHFTAKDNGILNASNYVIFCVSCIGVGALARTANKRHPFGWSKTTVRKVFQSIASFGVGFILLGVSFSVCQKTSTQVLLMLMFFITTFGTGGEAQIPLDISERYAGTIHALGGSLAVSGAIEPILVGYLMQGHAADKDSWRGVWTGASAIAFLGGFVFLFLGDATIQAFDSTGLNEANQTTRQDATSSSCNKLEKQSRENKAFEADIESGMTAATTTTTNGGSFRESAQI